MVDDQEQTEMQHQNLPVTREAVASLSLQLDVLKEFVASRLREGVDYGAVPGTEKKSLWKPGAEKLARLFNLGIRMFKTGSEIDRHQNFALFTYKAKAYPMKYSDLIVAECEASCNSQEKKYQSRTARGGAKEETPIFDIVNTLMKMAQKRAYVGVVILATGASDFFTQDIDDPEDAAALGVGAQPTRVKAKIPRATSAKSEQQANTGTPTCCGRPMMVSKFKNKETDQFDFYCTVCKSIVERPAG